MQNLEFVYVVYNFYKDKIKNIIEVPHASVIFSIRDEAIKQSNEQGDLVIFLEWLDRKELTNEEAIKSHVKKAIIASLNNKHYLCSMS